MTEEPKPDILFLGDGPTAPSALQSLIARCRVAHVFRQSNSSEADPVREFAALNDIPVSELQDLDQLSRLVDELKPAAVVISSFNRIIPRRIIERCRFINVHYSLLPQYRGRANVNWAIINGETAVGISIHAVVPDLDSGNVLFQQAIAIEPDDTVTSLYERLNAIQEHELGSVVLRAIRGYEGISQNPDRATYGCTRIPQDGEIDWRQPTDVIDRLIRSLTPPFPGAFTHLDTQQLIITRASPLPKSRVYVGRVPGRIVDRSSSEGWVDVLTGDGVLRVFSIVASNGPCTAASVIRSTKATLGLSRQGLLRRIVALEDRLAVLERSKG